MVPQSTSCAHCAFVYHLGWIYVYTVGESCHYLSHGFAQVKVVATNLNAAEEALEAYQREKQQRLNELLVVIPLKLHQVTSPPRVCLTLLGQKQCSWLTNDVPCLLVGGFCLQQDIPNPSYPFRLLTKEKHQGMHASLAHSHLAVQPFRSGE